MIAHITQMCMKYAEIADIPLLVEVMYCLRLRLIMLRKIAITVYVAAAMVAV